MSKHSPVRLFLHSLFTGLGFLFLFSCALPSLTLGETTNEPASAKEKTQNLINRHLVDIVKKMPREGGYSTGKNAADRLTNEAIVWDEQSQKLKVTPEKATPSFCSSACYLVLVQLLQRCPARTYTPEVWQALDAQMGQKDGFGIWGRANANGPGFAKLIHDLGAGFNFEDQSHARPGDFLKIFWTPEIGHRERGHLVIYLGLAHTPDGKPAIQFWSSNQGVGYSQKTVPLDRMSRLLFTRITDLRAFQKIPTLPPHDPWLESLLKKPTTWKEVQKKCGVHALGSP